MLALLAILMCLGTLPAQATAMEVNGETGTFVIEDAEEDAPSPDPSEPSPDTGEGTTVEFEVTFENPANSTDSDDNDPSGSRPANLRLPNLVAFGASTPADRAHPFVSSLPVPCGEYLYFEIDAAYNLIIWDPPKCIEVLTCGSERVDDIYFGRISGTGELTGAYADYLNEVVGSTAASPGGVTDVDLDATNTSLLAAGLGDSPDPLALATFRWCRNAAGEFDRTDPIWGVNFSWDTNFEAEYDRDRIVDGLFEQVRTRLTTYRPEVASAPPISVGHTYVKFPTWLWIHDPLETVSASSDQDLGHIQASIRATLTEAVFDFGGDSITCDPSELIAYVEGVTHPVEHVGPCHQVFETVTSFDLTAELTYSIEQRVSTRSYATQPWSHGSWEPHATATIEITSTAVRYEVHELLSLNVNEELELASG